MASKILLCFTLLTCFTACGGSSSTSELPAGSLVWKEQASGFNHKIDILWVLDSTSSMAVSHAELAHAMDTLFAKMISLRLDFKMAAITSDMRSGVSESRGQLLGNPKVLDLDTWNLQEAFSNLVQPSVSPLAEVRAFDALHASLNEQNFNGAMQFLREEALLVVIFMSDKQDHSQLSVGQMHFTMEAAKPYINRQAWVAHAITAKSSDCGFSKATNLETLAQESGGVSVDLCSGIDTALEKIRERSFEIATQISLAINTNPQHLKVINNGYEVPNQSQNGWMYYPESHSIRFYGNAQPATDAIIKVLGSETR